MADQFFQEDADGYEAEHVKQQVLDAEMEERARKHSPQLPAQRQRPEVRPERQIRLRRWIKRPEGTQHYERHDDAYARQTDGDDRDAVADGVRHLSHDQLFVIYFFFHFFHVRISS